MQSQQILKMSSSSPNAGMQATVPLVDGIVNHVLLQSGVAAHSYPLQQLPRGKN